MRNAAAQLAERRIASGAPPPPHRRSHNKPVSGSPGQRQNGRAAGGVSRPSVVVVDTHPNPVLGWSSDAAHAACAGTDQQEAITTASMQEEHPPLVEGAKHEDREGVSVQNRPKKANQLDQSGYRWDKLGKLEGGGAHPWIRRVGIPYSAEKATAQISRESGVGPLSSSIPQRHSD